METIYPSKEEIKFRKKNFGVIEDILEVSIECTICNADLLNEIILKKMIMVHRSHLFLCCYNCFYKLCEGNEYSCVLCYSNKELSNCEKCNLNSCNRCIANHKLDQISHGVLNKCFACTPQILWKQRAQSANVLKVFSSQLDMPNGLLVNEIEREQSVRKYLIKEAQNDYNSIIDNIKNQMCVDFMFNSYKKNIIEKLFDYSPKIIDSIPINEHLKQFVNIGEHILEKTCSTLTDFKRIFNLNSNLNPGVYAIMKSLLKPIDEDENTLNTSKLTGHTKINVQNNKSNQSLKMFKTICSESSNEKNADDTLKATTPSSENINIDPMKKKIIKEVAVVLERLDDSVLSKIIDNKLSKNITDDKMDKIVHPLDLFNDNSSSDEKECTRKLRSHKGIKTDKKEDKILTEKLSKHKKKLDTKSDDEKEINRLININNIGKYHGKKVLPVEDGSDMKEQSDNNQTFESNKNTNTLIVSKNEVDKMKLMKQTIQNIDEIDDDIDDNSQNNETTLDFCDVFNEIEYTTDIPSIVNSEPNGDESEDSCINEVVNMCLTTCNQHKIDKCGTKAKENKINYHDVFSDSGSEDELENEENTEMVKSSNNDNNMPTCLIQPLSKLSSSSDSDLKREIIQKGKKRKVILQSDSDSSSKYFKKRPKKIKINDKFIPIFSSSSSNNSSSDEYQIKPVCIQKRKKKFHSDEVSDDNSDASNSINRSPRKGRKNIRKLKTEKELSELTQNALKEEEYRKKRIESRQKLYNKMYEAPTPCMESISKLVLDFEPETKKELITVHPNLVKLLKPHQVEGIKFLWNSVFESLGQIKKSKGNGSILAHCMGLGKTLQVITLVHTLFRHPETGIKTVLVVTPHATIENWCKEFHKWLKDIPDDKKFSVFNLTETKTYGNRKHLIQEWREDQGVLITSYQMYRTLLNYQQIKRFPAILEGLVDPGPDLIICDEGHILKNQTTATSKALNKIKTLRRIVLTGTPLQNNLKEYHCMVDFIRPNLLGSIKDFTNRFINPITNGQYSDSTPQDVRLMKRRSHVLHRMLEGFVQRFDYSVLTPYLPPKHEYVIYLKMSDIQIELYRNYLDNHRQTELFTNYNILQMIWTHPKLLPLYVKRIENKREKENIKDFINDHSDSTNSNSGEEHNENEAVPLSVLDVTSAKIPEMDSNWWKPLLTKKNLNTVYPYSKFIMMFSILKECEEIGDKVILFSQSLHTLDLIQDFLENTEDLANDFGGPYGESWIHGQDFFRIDGSVPLKNREDCCTKFNDVTNTKLRLLLLSTKAFNLGINLVGANRVIIFDVTWNPSLNVQSIFRIFRFGQTKPCYIYRLVSEGTMEQKIYERQISKLSMAFRVVDEHQIDRHFNAKDQEVLYEFEPTFEPQTTLNLPKDRLMAELILKHKDLVINILEHDSLLQNNEAEELNESDRNAAWEDYQIEKDGLLNQPHQNIQLQMNDQYYLFNLNMQQNPLLRTEPEDISLFNMLRSYFPQATMLQLNDMLNQVKRVQGVEQ